MKIKLQAPIIGMSGKMGDKVFFTRNGQIFCRKAGKRQTQVQASEKARREKFGIASRATNRIMNDPIEREYWEKQYRAQGKYKSFRGYVFSNQMKGLNNEKGKQGRFGDNP